MSLPIRIAKKKTSTLPPEGARFYAIATAATAAVQVGVSKPLACTQPAGDANRRPPCSATRLLKKAARASAPPTAEVVFDNPASVDTAGPYLCALAASREFLFTARLSCFQSFVLS
jgi:hypothetical protein